MAPSDNATMARFRRVRQGLLVTAVVLAALAPLMVLFGAVGSRSGWFGLHVGFDWMTIRIAPALAAVGLALGLLALASVFIAPQRTVAMASLAAVALSALTFAGVTEQRLVMAREPPIHDVATDWNDPILFSSKMMLARGVLANLVQSAPAVPYTSYSPDLAAVPVASVNARTCPAATPVTLPIPPAEAYARARAAVAGLHWAMVTDDPAAGVLEATAISPWFGFKDDVALRIRAAGAGARIDSRASARLGLSDFGRDCRHITRLRSALAG